jgi:tRNA-2-methylthio-N6-dimethylallyladenosine synthase
MVARETGKRVWVQALGCQMNKHDSEVLLSQLASLGYEPVEEQAEADLVVFHTCSVRAHAEERAYSLIGATRALTQRRPGVVVAVVGCMAQREGAGLRARAPHVRLVVGTHMLGEFPQLLWEVERTGGAVVATGEGARLWPGRLPRFRHSSFQAFVAIMRGCSNACSYCIVPLVRGRAVSREPADIAFEVEALAADGVVEVTLLGQNVDAYGRDRPQERWSLAGLLRRLHEVRGLRRLRFVTSHPGDVTEELLRTMAELPRVSPYLHLPVQSGSDAVLARMRRGYTRGQYLQVVERARTLVPGVTLASDFIVGFPGETEEEFRQSGDLLARVRFKNSFIFKYSPRPGTAAAGCADDVPREVKKRRNQELLAVQAEVSLALNREGIGRTLPVLVEGPSKRDPTRLTGRTPGDRIVCFPGPASCAGEEVDVLITGATALVLHGELVGPGAEATAGTAVAHQTEGGAT